MNSSHCWKKPLGRPLLKDIYSKNGMIAMIPEEPKRRQAVEWVERGNELYEGGLL